jgi:hypothetical protein
VLIAAIISWIRTVRTHVHHSHSPTLNSVSLVPTVDFPSRMLLPYYITQHIPTWLTLALNMRQYILLKHFIDESTWCHNSEDDLDLLIDCSWVSDLTVPTHLGLILTDPLCSVSIHGSSVALLKVQMAPNLILLMSSGSKKKDPRCICLNEAKTLHLQRIWAELSSSAPYLLHSGLSDSPIK